MELLSKKPDENKGLMRYKLKDREQEVVDAYLNGASSTEVAALFDVSHASILQCLEKMGVARRATRSLKTHCKRGHERNAENVTRFGQCRLCANEKAIEWRKDNPEKNKATMDKSRKKWADKNPEYHKYHWLMRKYDISKEDYDAKLTAQENKCAICQRLMDRPNVDHDHETDQVRDLLCYNCNSGLGQFMDDPLIVQAATDYLKCWKAV
jgi:transposase